MDLDRAQPVKDVEEEPSLSHDPRPSVGGWSAEESREYHEFALRSEIESFRSLYGDQALITQLADIGRDNGFNAEART